MSFIMWAFLSFGASVTAGAPAPCAKECKTAATTCKSECRELKGESRKDCLSFCEATLDECTGKCGE
ncbi:MAG: hypothetical protein IT385_06135 [Deltaproteobacteria bacterium]|nr:hypothetical protein [Deltaproteobacteria bacterium]